ncbi:MAG TPA: LemA family protein [Pirellulaceae bacterium]|nr:LemA family protein [Pirellulaceae bacterium]
MPWIILSVILGLLLIFILYAVSVYNGLVTMRNRYKNAYAQIDVQLKRRYDLIPNLVEVAKGYMKHEQETLTQVIEARNKAFAAGQSAAANPGDPSSMKNLASAEANLNGALGRLLMIAEAYPDLKANQNMMALQEELTATENKVSFSRQGFNDSVTGYNTAREQFPAVIVANMFGFTPAQWLELENPKEREAPKVQF